MRDAAEDGWTSLFVLDSFEKLTDPPEYPGRRTGPGLDQWVRDLLATSRRTAAIIFSRLRLNWNQYASEAWGDSFVPSLLDRLDPRDVEEFLIHVPIQDRALRAHITNICDGSPFLIDLCLDAWKTIVQSGRQPKPEDIGIDTKRIIERFMAGRSLQEFSTIKALSFPDVFDATLFAFVVRELGTGYPPSEFDRFAELSFVRKLEGSSLFHLHHNMRKAVLTSLTPSERDAILDVLVRFCMQAPMKPDSDLSVAAITLGLQLLAERSEVGGWLYGAARDLIGAGYWPEIDRLLSDFLGRLDEDAERVTTLIRSLVLRRWGKIDEAITAHHDGRPALVAPHSSFADFHYANLLRIKGSYDQAERTYRKVSTEDTDPRTRLLATKQLADLLMLKGSFRRSQAVLDGIARDGIEPSDEAELLRQQGHIYRWNFLLKEATAAYESAFRIATAESLRSMMGRLETNLVELHTLCGTEPGELLERALQTNQIIGAQLEIGKVRCARAIYFTTRAKDVDQARHELAEGLRSFRSTGYRAGFAFVLMARVLLDLANDRRRAGRSLARLVQLTNSLGVYRFLARGLHETLDLPLPVLPAGRVFWLDPSHALASWQRLVVGARG